MVFTCKTWVAKILTDPEADADGAAVFEVLANAGLPINSAAIERIL